MKDSMRRTMDRQSWGEWNQELGTNQEGMRSKEVAGCHGAWLACWRGWRTGGGRRRPQRNA